MSLIKVKDLSVYKNSFPILEKISFTLKEGEIVRICGKNRTGKSTFLKFILNLEKIDSGEISFFNSSKKFRGFKGKIGYLPQILNGSFYDVPVIVYKIVISKIPNNQK